MCDKKITVGRYGKEHKFMNKIKDVSDRIIIFIRKGERVGKCIEKQH